MPKKTNQKRPKELKVGDIYIPQISPEGTARKNWFLEYKELIVLTCTFILAAFGICYKLGKLEAELRGSIENSNHQVQTLLNNQQQTASDITNIKIEIGKHQTEINYLKETKISY